MDEKNKGKKRPVDDAGIRLAPTPIRSNDMNVLPPVKQDFIIVPQIEINEKDEDVERISTLKDYQPKKEDMSKRWKRTKRGKNMVVGTIALIVTVFSVLPYILGACGVEATLPFKYIPTSFNAIHEFIEAFKDTANLGWKGEGIKEIWFKTVPDMVLIIGIIALAINLIKSFYALFISSKQVKFVGGAIVYLVCVLLVFGASLLGVDVLGIEKIDFMNDFIRGCSTCELFTLVITSIGYLLVCGIITLVNRDKQGYLV